jgi:aryl-alcohol dehydrogenase-like predicted oxidoreductase
MEYRQLGRSGLRVPVLSFGTGTFGGTGPLFGAWGRSDAREARRLLDICLDAGVNLFDTADVYSDGASEQVLGEAIKGRRDAVLISTKTGLPTGEGANDWGASRARLVRVVEGMLKRLGTDYIDLLQLHAFDASTPVEELLENAGPADRRGQATLRRRVQLPRLAADEAAGCRRPRRSAASRGAPSVLLAGRPRLRS